jgi:hypothetical protein
VHDPENKIIWKAKIPEKIKIFFVVTGKQGVLTKENMIKRNGQGDPACY